MRAKAGSRLISAREPTILYIDLLTKLKTLFVPLAIAE